MVYKIKKFREEKGWSQETLAKKAGVSRTIISGLESGSIETTTTKTLLNIAGALNKKVEEIFLEEKFNILNENKNMTDEEKANACELILNSLNSKCREEYPEILQSALIYKSEDGKKFLQATLCIE